MTRDGIARVKACFDSMIEVYPVGDPRSRVHESQATQSGYLPQMPQLPQHQAPACKVLTDQEDAYEERAAIMEYDGGLPRVLAEYFAGHCRDPSSRATK